MATLLPRQSNILSSAADVKNTFSSWDGCMSKAYCKWPVIIGIIIGSLIVISVLWCFARCICCGKDLVCCCFRCCGGNKGHKHLDSVPPTPYNPQYNQQYNQQYQSHAPPIYAGPAAFSQTATFDSSGKVHEDSLPAMPSWETAASRKVEVLEEPESHEMDHLNGDISPNLRSNTTSPLARPIPMRNGSGPSMEPSIPSSPHLPDVGYGGRGPYGSDHNSGQYNSRTNLQGSSPNIYGSRSNLVGDTYNGYHGTTPNRSAGSYGNDSYDGYGHESKSNQPTTGTNRPPRSPGGYGAPGGAAVYDYGSGNGGHQEANDRYQGGNDRYQRSNDQYQRSNDQYQRGNDRYQGGNDRYQGGNSFNRYGGTQNPYGNSSYDRQPAAGSWKDI